MYRILTKLRLHGYGIATGRLLMRHWQMFVIAGVFVPAGIPVEAILLILAYPLVAVFNANADHGLIWHLSYLLLIQLVALTWVLIQTRNIAGNDFTIYANTLPISQSLRRRVNLTLLLLANSILLIPVISLFLLAPTRLVQAVDKGFLIAAVSVLVVLVHLIQLAAIERQRMAFLPIAIADFLLAMSLSGPIDSVSWLALGASLFCATLSLANYRIFEQQSAKKQSVPVTGTVIFARLAPDWQIQAKALWVQNTASSATRMGITIVVSASAVGLANIFNFDARTLPAAILAMGLIALIVSGLYRVLNTIHVPMQHYLSSLPLHKTFWLFRDTTSVLLFATVPLIILLVPILSHVDIKPVIGIVLTYFALLALLRLPLVYGGRQALLLSVLLVSAWSGATMAAIF